MDLLLKIPRLPLSLYTSSGKRRINCSMCNCQLIACPLPGVKAKAIIVYSLLSAESLSCWSTWSRLTSTLQLAAQLHWLTKSPWPSADTGSGTDRPIHCRTGNALLLARYWHLSGRSPSFLGILDNQLFGQLASRSCGKARVTQLAFPWCPSYPSITLIPSLWLEAFPVPGIVPGK